MSLLDVDSIDYIGVNILFKEMGIRPVNYDNSMT